MFKNALAKKLPEGIKKPLRLVYNGLFYRHPDLGSTLEINPYGQFDVVYRKKTADERVIEHSFDNDIFFSGMPEYIPSSGDVIIDVGAHIGTFSMTASRSVGDGKVYAIEASKDTYNYLRLNIALNKLENVSSHHLALSDKNGSLKLYHSKGNWGHSIVKELSDQSEEVRCCSLQTFMKDNEIEHCNFIKFNCEGAEFPILMSTPKNIMAKIDNMLVLYHSFLWKEHSKEELMAYLQECGFETELRNDNPDEGWIVAQKKS